MMIEMLVHQDPPFLRGEASEETVRMICASHRPGYNQAIDQSIQPFAFRIQVAIIEHLKARHGWGVSSHRLVITESFRFDEASEQTPNQHAWGQNIAQCLLHAFAAMRNRLGGIHLSPLTWTVGA